MKRFIFILLVFNLLMKSALCQFYVDSLYEVFNDTEKTDSVRIDALYTLSYTHVYAAPDSAQTFAKKLIEFAIANKMPSYEARAHTVIGATYTINGQYLKALDEQLKAAEGFQRCKMDIAMANVDNNIGMIYISVLDFKTAITFFKKAIRVYKRLVPKSLRLVNSIENTGIAFSNLYQFDSAETYYRRGLSLIENHGDEGIRTKTSIYSNMADLMNHYKKRDSARYYYQKSLELSEISGDQISLSASLSNLGVLFVRDHQPETGIKYCLNGLALARQINSLKEEMYNCRCLYEAYEQLNMPKQALKYYKNYIILRDSSNNLNQSKALARKEIEYYYNKKKLADSLQHIQTISDQKIKYKEKQSQLKQAKMQGLILLISVLLLIVLAFFIYYRLKVTRTQKKIIEVQKERVEMGKMLLEQKNTEIMDSMRYAKRIQDAILPAPATLREYLPDSFILYRPKDIVAGDFYWMEAIGPTGAEDGRAVLFAACDCTGHGVPGAMVSVVCHNALNRSVREYGLSDPGKILDKARELVVAEFEKSEEDVKDGMDISLCKLSFRPGDGGAGLEWAGANNPLWIARQNPGQSPELIEIKADKQPIGKYPNQRPFSKHKIKLQKGNMIYLFSDGFPDQFGGLRGKKFKYKAFKTLLLEICEQDVREQKKTLISRFESWKGTLEQVDDVCVMGVRV